MDICHFFIVFLFINSYKAEVADTECNSASRIPDASNCSRYQECFGGKWIVNNCSLGYRFDDLKNICVPGRCNQNATTESPYLNVISQIEKDGYEIELPSSNKNFNKKHGVSKRATYKVDQGGSTISRHTRQTTYKSFRSYTKRKGNNVRTTLWYYNSEGPNFKFTISGELPATREEMIEWLENNSYNYVLTKVPYKGDAEEGSDDFKLRGPIQSSYQTQTYRPPTPTRRPDPPIYRPDPPIYRPEYPTRRPDPPTRRPDPPTRRPDPPTRRPPTFTEQKPPTNWKEILPSNCGFSGLQLRDQFDKVINGVPVAIEDNPWQVALVDSNTKNLACGGSIISLHHVLTACHCFVKDQTVVRPDGSREKVPKILPKTSYVVYAGSSNINEVTVSFTILDLYLHDKYKGSHKRNDIALILINGSFSWTHRIYPICLPARTIEYKPKRQCRVSGWGKTLSESSRTEDYLHGAPVAIVEPNDCKKENQKFVNISSGMFCAGDFDKGSVDTCQGDSGGPCACMEEGRGTLFGITSWGIGCGRANYPGVYAKVSLYRKWIEQYLEVSMGVRSRDSLTYDEDIGADDDLDKNAPSTNTDPDEDILW